MTCPSVGLLRLISNFHPLFECSSLQSDHSHGTSCQPNVEPSSIKKHLCGSQFMALHRLRTDRRVWAPFSWQLLAPKGHSICSHSATHTHVHLGPYDESEATFSKSPIYSKHLSKVTIWISASPRLKIGNHIWLTYKLVPLGLLIPC